MSLPFLRAQELAFAFNTLIITHYFACLWSFVAESQTPNLSWIDKYSMNSQSELDLSGDNVSSLFDRYVLCLYWATMTITSIGYGDVTPLTQAEYWICTFAMLVGAVIWAFIVATAVA